MTKPNKSHSIKNARLLLRQSEVGVLSTHSKACSGYPFGSVSTFISTHEGDIIFYISDLAQHTHNIKHDAKMCLTVFSAESTRGRRSDDPNAEARLSLLGTAEKVEKESEASVAERYFSLYPDSKKYQGAHDFAFYKMKTERVRYIGGFGDIHWIKEDDWRLPTPEWKSGELGMIHHMNEDHLDAMKAIYSHHIQKDCNDVKMLAVNPDGAFYQCGDAKPVFIPFDSLAIESQSVRMKLVAQTNSAREALGIVKEAV